MPKMVVLFSSGVSLFSKKVSPLCWKVGLGNSSFDRQHDPEIRSTTLPSFAADGITELGAASKINVGWEKN